MASKTIGTQGNGTGPPQVRLLNKRNLSNATMAHKPKRLIFKSFKELRDSPEWQRIAAFLYMEQSKKHGARMSRKRFENDRRERERVTA